ncbi:hypothetical protein GUITHDRAFT_156748, partial [Guillardia theta CCMP2712]
MSNKGKNDSAVRQTSGKQRTKDPLLLQKLSIIHFHQTTGPLEPGEIQVWIQRLSNRKAAGMDLISNEILKALPKNELCHVLENQRPICVLSSVTRIFQAVIAHRLAKAA